MYQLNITSFACRTANIEQNATLFFNLRNANKR